MNNKKVLITDIDNTLFDWFAMWHASFNAMINSASQISGVPLEELYIAAKIVHNKYGTAEYAFLLEELDPLIKLYGDKESLMANLSPAVDAFRIERKKHMVLYPGVFATLQSIIERGMVVLAFSESKSYYSSYRIRELGLDGIVKTIYCPADHDLPSNRDKTELLKLTQCCVLPGDFKKPDPEILLQILDNSGFRPEEVLYVGDSKSKDIKMAVDAGIDYLWYESGATHLSDRKGDYDLLKKVTHWSQAEVDAEKILADDSKKMVLCPSKIIRSYSEILDNISLDRPR